MVSALFNLCNNLNIIKERTKFYNNFNVLFRKFCNVDFNILFLLFKTHCHQLYGAALWYNNFSCSPIIKQFANGYHSAIKIILKVPKCPGPPPSSRQAAEDWP